MSTTAPTPLVPHENPADIVADKQGYCPIEDAWYGEASGPNKIRHRVRLCLKSGTIHIHALGKSDKPVAVIKSLGERGLTHADWGFSQRFVLIAKRVDANGEKKTQSKEPAYGESGANGERWITVHPGGGEEGHPIKIVPHHDGSWRVVGGAGGALNGLKIHHVKSPEEYKHAAKQKAQEKKQAAEKQSHAQREALEAKHRDAIAKESLETGTLHTPESLHQEAQKRAADEFNADAKAKRERGDELQAQQRADEKELIAGVAKAQGWNEDDITLSPEALEVARRAAQEELLASNPKLRDQPDKLREKADAVVARVEEEHHKKLLSRAREVLDNHREMILAAHDDLAGAALGDLSIGDLVTNTLGDGGKGYAASLAQEALERGIDAPHLRDMADEDAHQKRLERHGGDEGAAARAQEAIERLHAGAARSRAGIDAAKEKLGEAGAGLERLKDLDATPKGNVANSAKLLAEAKALDARIKGAQSAKKELEGATGGLEALPTAAVVVGKEITEAEAMKRVQQDLNEIAQTRAVTALHGLYKTQSEELGSLRSHTLAGHSAFFGNVAHIITEKAGIGLRGPDPLMADILGPSASAHVFALALRDGALDENGQIDNEALAHITQALRDNHIEGQVALCDAATTKANALFKEAERRGEGLNESMGDVDGLLSGLQRNQERLNLLRQGRELVGVAMGKMEAAAALNEALMYDGADVQTAIGAIDLEEAHRRAASMGLTTPDKRDGKGNVVEPGEYHIEHDGKNAILVLHRQGLEKIASQLSDNKEHLERVALAASIKRGDFDEKNGWLPEGFSRRPTIDVSGGDGDALHLPVRIAFSLGDATTPENVEGRIGDHVAECLEAGQDGSAILHKMRSAIFKADLPDEARPVYESALERMFPRAVSSEKSEDAVEYLENEKAALKAVHDAWVSKKVASGEMESGAASVHRQLLPQDLKTQDLAYQVAIQDPRLQHAFKDVGALGKKEKRAIRDYAYEKIFKLDPKSKETPITALEPDELKAWQGWRDLCAKNFDPYTAIQEHWRKADESNDAGGGLFGLMEGDSEEKEPHTFTTVDLNDDDAVLAAARKHAEELGYEKTHIGFNPKTLSFERAVVDGLDGELVPGEKGGESVLSEFDEIGKKHAAEMARRRIQGALRGHAFSNMFGVASLGEKATKTPKNAWNPERVRTAGERWGQYVKSMGETKAIQTVQEIMRGDFCNRFSRGFEQLHDKPLLTAPVPLTHGERHLKAMRSGDKLADLSKTAKEIIEQRARDVKGRLMSEGKGSVKEKMEAAKQIALTQEGLVGGDDTTTTEHKKAASRLSMGEAAEKMVAGMLPQIHLKRGTVAAGNIDMSSDEGIKRQRAIKLLEATGSLLGTLGVGTGKTSIILGGFSHLKAKGKVNRALVAVPSVVQEQFGSEAARFYDPTSPHFPSWHADSSASKEERRAAYHRDSGRDICVVTHQSLRDDLTWALAQSKFGGDEKAARDYIMGAPRHESTKAIGEAMRAQGWDFDFTAGDEIHNLLDREGKPDSHASNALAVLSEAPYKILASADPVKNDACIHPDTPIQDAKTGEVMPVSEWVALGRAPWVWALDNEKRPQLVRASVPFVKHRAAMYRVTLESGEQIIVAGSHRFLAPSGWQPLSALSAGNTIAVAVP